MTAPSSAPGTPDTHAHARPSSGAARTRKKALTALAAVVVLCGLGWAVYSHLVSARHESTDNAYVQGQVIQITPQMAGTVINVLADDSDYVKAGQPLVQLDPADVRLALEQAQANLAQTVRQVRTLYVNNGALAAQIALREAEVLRTQGDLARANDDLSRRQGLSGSGAVSQEDLQHARAQASSARSQLAAAQAGLMVAREQLQSNQALTDGLPIERHPSVQLAAAKLREAHLAAQRTALLAPVDGYVAKRTVQLGQRVAAGTPLMSVIPLRSVWVEANFKEPQLRGIRLGQNVKLVADLYGSTVEYQGTVAGLGVGTGAAFALLPAQNATGNWIKVVQRVPVRIALDPQQLLAHPLRVGLSMQADVDVSQQGGKALADTPVVMAPAPAKAMATAAVSDPAQDDIRRIIVANLGAKPARAASPASARPQNH